MLRARDLVLSTITLALGLSCPSVGKTFDKIIDPNDPRLAAAKLLDFDSEPFDSAPPGFQERRFPQTPEDELTMRWLAPSGELAVREATAIDPPVGSGRAVQDPFVSDKDRAEFEFIFDFPVSAVAFDFGAVNESWIMTLLDAQGNEIPDEWVKWGREEINTSANTFSHIGAYLPGGFRGLRMAQETAAGDLVGLDNLQWVYTPEPSTLVLALIGILGLAWLLRVRHR